MTKQEKALGRALEGFQRTGDDDLDSMVDTANQLTAHLAVAPPAHPQGRALFVEGVAARKRSFMSSLAAPAMAVAALLVFIAIMGRSALPGESLYPVRKVLRSAGLASAPTNELQRQLQDAELLIKRAQAALKRGSDDVERFAGAALMSLGRAEGYLGGLDAADRVTFEARIDALRDEAVALIQLDANLNSGKGHSGSGGESSGSDDNSGSGSVNSGVDDNSGPGSDDSGSDDASSGSGSGSDDSGIDDSGSGSDSSGSDSDSSGPGSGDDADQLRDEREDLADEKETD